MYGIMYTRTYRVSVMNCSHGVDVHGTFLSLRQKGDARAFYVSIYSYFSISMKHETFSSMTSTHVIVDYT